jgi:sulfite exporter TauE/SafE
MALSLTTSVDTPWAAVGVMYAFGLGTVPMLVSLVVLKRRITARFSKASLYRFVPIIMLFFGSLFLLRGLNLGIPYLSPSVSIEQNEVKSSCCHKH